MLIERASGVADSLAGSWRAKTDAGANEHSIKLLDLLNELLRGVVGGETAKENEVCHKVADLYVFLSQHLIAAESTSDANSIDEIKTVLEIEAETWRAVCAQELTTTKNSSADAAAAASGGLNFEA
jgi:flagellar protein FliS